MNMNTFDLEGIIINLRIEKSIKKKKYKETKKFIIYKEIIDLISRIKFLEKKLNESKYY